MTTTNGALTLAGLGQRALARRPLGRSVAVAALPATAAPVSAPSMATAPAADGLLSDRAMIAFVVMKETAAALAITALVLAAILL
ncbi:MAG: hypothetical protein JNL90_19305 [Planctomycetes bacterium]|nr:hypothetical protein [Planctomycetota bacterium]